ncbi:hypothetical protein HYX07_02255 [Candidatus Woesearchaeota archaeon]|nr:hypothetical protein [Candidatus Woesearchaeota archaeon]
MADEERSLEVSGASSNFIEQKIKNRIIRLRNRFARTKLGENLGFMQEPEIGRTGASDPEIRKELGPIFDLNTLLIDRLKNIEQRAWQEFKEKIWGKGNSVVAYYRKMSFLTDPEIIQLEKMYFESGTQFSEDEQPIQFGTEPTDTIHVKKYSLGTERVAYLDDGELFPENISVIGHARIPKIQEDWRRQFDDWSQIAQQLDRELGGIWSGMNALDRKIKESLVQIREREIAFQEKWLSQADRSSRDLKALRTSLEELRPKNIRFFHTYKIIAPVIRDPKTGNLRYFAREFPNFKREDEVEAGLDENGWPLEVDENGVVLLDKWWLEIADNKWQEKIITEDGKFEYPAGSGIFYEGKGKKGGKEVWKAKVDNGVLKGGIRRIPKIFVKDLDLLLAALYMFHELDAVRDSLRTGFDYPYSKTAMDYFLASEGLSTIFYEGDRTFAPGELRKICGPMPYNMGTEPVIPKERITKDFNPMKEYIAASPSDFMDVPDDEKRVTREYQMKLNLDEYDYTIEKGIRKPSQLNPAYDRSALNCKVLDFHWGRMHYYGSKEEINQWSECPFPKNSSRGLPKNVANRLLKELYWDDAVRVGKNRIGWDIGIRRPLVGGDFPTDLLGASDLISTKRHFETVREEASR